MPRKRLPEVLVIILAILLIVVVVKIFDRKLEGISVKASGSTIDSTINKNNTK